MVQLPKPSIVSKVSSFLSVCKMLNDIADTGEKRFDILAKEDLAYFLFTLAESDASINNSELYFILKCLQIESLREVDIDSCPSAQEYLTLPPKSLTILVKIDNLVVEKDLEEKIPHLCEMLIDVYQSLGKELLIVDDFIDDVELDWLNKYLYMLRDYFLSNSIRSSDMYRGDTILYEDIDPDHENVFFLGETIRVPEIGQILQYKTLMARIAKNYAEMNEFLTSKCEEIKKNDDKYGIHILRSFYDSYGSDYGIVTKDILELMEACGSSICPYDDSERKYVQDTEGYQTLRRLCVSLEAEAKRLYIAKEQAIKQGQNLAYLRASSQITGMSYGIITNSVPDLLLYHAISKSTLKQQARRADAQYREEASNNAKEVFAAFTSSMRKLFFDVFIPISQKCIDLWINEVTAKAIEFESNHDMPLCNEISKYDIQISESIVQSITAGMDENTIITELQRAFKKCPFDDSIYEKAAQLAVMDEKSAKTAHSLGSYYLPDNVIRFCKNKINDVDYVRKQINLLKIIDKERYEDKVSNIYSPIVNSIKKQYSSWINAKTNRNVLISNIKSLSTFSDMFSFISASEDKIKQLIRISINKIVTNEMFLFLIEQKLLSPSELMSANMSDLEQINNHLFETIIPVVISYHQEMIDKRQKWNDEMSEYYSICTNYKNEIDGLAEELEQTFFIMFKRKAELKKIIEEKTAEYTNYKNNRKPSLTW